MTKPPQPDQSNPTLDCLYATICGFILPFFLAAAGGNVKAARAAVAELIDAYNPATPTELDLVGRIIGFSIVAMDNLRLSMDDDLSTTKLLRYRSNAVSLSRASEQARVILQAIQAKRETTAQIPRPAVAAAPAPSPPARTSDLPRATALSDRTSTVTATGAPVDFEAMKRDARVMMAAFSKQGAQASTAIAAIPDSAAFAKSAPFSAATRRA
jgi:hypothetical protein